MKRLATAALLIFASTGLVLAQAAPPAAPAAKGPNTSQAIQQLERDWTNAMKNGETDKLNAILADDWMGISPVGERTTKQAYIADVQSGANKAQSVEIGPMDVKVLGNVAVVQGSDTEKSTYKGKDTSGKYVWMDVFVKRGDKWVAVRSQAALLK